jgi:salicylate hydroxylase
MGQGAHLLTFPVNQGKLVNVVAFCTNADNWTDYPQLTRPAKREDAMKDFQAFNSNVHAILRMVDSDLECV